MTRSLNETHAPEARSWVTSANVSGNDFPLQNLPLGVFDDGAGTRIGVAIGDQVLDLHAASEAGLLSELPAEVHTAVARPTLNHLMQLGTEANSSMRRAIFKLLEEASPRQKQCAALLKPQTRVQMLLPASIGDYTDFYASIFHATNVGSMFRPDNPLLPNYKWVPIGYHGRASSIVASGAAVPRPAGQTKADDATAPVFGPTQRLDYELEVGVFIGRGNSPGSPITLAHAEQHAFGLCLVNDWSARDMQAWEYQPLGPFLAKNFLTSISPWVVTMEALAPFRTPAFKRAAQDPQPLPYLTDAVNESSGGFDITLEVWLRTEKMRTANLPAVRLSLGSFIDMYWTLAQMIAHHTSNGCNLQPGDLLASGTVSGPEKSSRGCLLELAWRGTEPITLKNGEQRRFLLDGDEIILRGYCERPGAARIGFGECRGTVVDSPQPPIS
jgi:fumarylacetoacetase